MLFSRYSSAAKYILENNFEFGLEMVRKARSEKIEEAIQQRWLIGGYEKEVSLAEFRGKLMGAVQNTPEEVPGQEKSEKEIYDKVKKILEMKRR